jgi:hypothetical protein
MKEDTPDRRPVAWREQREFLDQIRNDHELIERLSITTEELDVLSKCALFGTLTCKQDMLFILRQLRQPDGPAAGGPIDQAILFPQPAEPQEQEEDPIPPDLRRIAVRVGGTAVPEPGSLKSTDRRRIPKQVTIAFWTVVLILGLVWNFLIAMLHWRNNFTTSIGIPAGQAADSAAWYSNFDQPNILLWGELLIVLCIALVMTRKSRKGYPRLKVRPQRTWP